MTLGIACMYKHTRKQGKSLRGGMHEGMQTLKAWGMEFFGDYCKQVSTHK